MIKSHIPTSHACKYFRNQSYHFITAYTKVQKLNDVDLKVLAIVVFHNICIQKQLLTKTTVADH